MPILLNDLLDASPYLRELHLRHGAWLSAALAAPDEALRQVLDGLAAAAVTSGTDDVAIGAALRRAKAQVALLGRGRDGRGVDDSTIDRGALGPRGRGARCRAGRAAAQGHRKGDLSETDGRAIAASTLFALGKHGGRELNYSSDIDIVAFFDRQARRAARRRARRPSSITAHRAAARRADAGPRRAPAMCSAPICGSRPDPGSTPVALSIGCGARLLREPRPELGACGLDQGAALRRRQGGRVRRSSRSSRPMSGASISTSRPSPTSRR